MFGLRKKTEMPTAETALPGRDMQMPVPESHFVLGTPLKGPWPAHLQIAMFGLGCFWGAERKFWVCEGVHSTQVGYAAGITANPTYEEVCSGGTGHNEVVQVIYDPQVISYDALLAVFWESHNPTQGMRQGNDVGTQYRSGIYCFLRLKNKPPRHRAKRFKCVSAKPVLTTSQPRLSTRQRFTMPRIITSNIWAKTQMVIAGLAARAFHARLV